MKHHKTFKLRDTLEFPDEVTHVFMVKKNTLVIVTGKKTYIYKGKTLTRKQQSK